MPLVNGDEFIVKYDRFDPGVNQIKFEAPSPAQLERYRARAASKHKQLHPSLAHTMAECEVDIAFNLEGVAGYALFYFQDRSTTDNKTFNQDAYHRLVRDVAFTNSKLKQCW